MGMAPSFPLENLADLLCVMSWVSCGSCVSRINAKFRPFLPFAVLRCSSMSRRTKYRSHLRFPETDPFPEYGGVEPENEEGGVDPYSVRVRQALLDMRSPAQVRKVEWMVRLLYLLA